MSTRFVWGRYSLTQKTSFLAKVEPHTYKVILDSGTSCSVYYGTGYNVNSTTGEITLVNRKQAYKDINESDYDDRGYFWYKADATTLYYGKLTCRKGGGEYTFSLDNPEQVAYVVEKTEPAKGSLLGRTSGPSQSTYPADGVSGSYWYTYLGSDNIDPTAVGYSTTTPKGGEDITIRVTARSNTYGGTISYRYQYSINGGQSWTDAGTTTATSKTVTVPKGAPTFQARVLASDNMGFTSSTWVTGAKLTVTNNTAPTISGTDGDLGTFALTPPQAVSYTINDADGNTVAVTVTLDGATVASFNATLGQANSYSIPGDRWLETLNGKHTIKITADDGQGGSAVRTYTFTKNVTTMSVQLAQPLPADAMITKAAETILASLPAGTKTKVEICNNGFDAAPTWEDVTVRALAGEKLFLANTKNTAGKWGYNIRVTVERGTAQGEVSLTSIAGFFE